MRRTRPISDDFRLRPFGSADFFVRNFRSTFFPEAIRGSGVAESEGMDPGRKGKNEIRDAPGSRRNHPRITFAQINSGPTFVMDPQIILRESDVIVLVLGAPGSRKRSFFFVHHRIQHLETVDVPVPCSGLNVVRITADARGGHF